MMMTVTYEGGKQVFNIEIIKNDDKFWLLYLNGDPIRIPARLKIVVSTQPE